MNTCRLCGSVPFASVVDLGATPPCERFLTEAQLADPEPAYPLHLLVCTECWLAQIPPLITPEDTFTEYAYFSSYPASWVEHAGTFVDEAVSGLGLDDSSFVVEVASDDGYLLRHVVERRIRCLGVEPSVNVGEAAPPANDSAAGISSRTSRLISTTSTGSTYVVAPSSRPSSWTARRPTSKSRARSGTAPGRIQELEQAVVPSWPRRLGSGSASYWSGR